jgi:hypothetical protein
VAPAALAVPDLSATSDDPADLPALLGIVRSIRFDAEVR